MPSVREQEKMVRPDRVSSNGAGPDEALRLRVHHLLCIPLYQGYGYGGDFCENMESVIRRLAGCPDTALRAVCGPDMICAGCPNLTARGACRTSGKNVDEKDRSLADQLGIREGGQYTYRQLLLRARQKLTEQIFDASCRNCEWYAGGLCSYQKWRAGLEESI